MPYLPSEDPRPEVHRKPESPKEIRLRSAVLSNLDLADETMNRMQDVLREELTSTINRLESRISPALAPQPGREEGHKSPPSDEPGQGSVLTQRTAMLCIRLAVMIDIIRQINMHLDGIIDRCEL